LAFNSTPPQYKLSGDLADLQANEQRDLFIAGALVGVAGGGIILLIEPITKGVIALITKIVKALRGPAEASVATRSEKSEPAAQITQESQVEPAPLIQGGEPSQPHSNAERPERDQQADEE
jgi:hypothetical protein